MPDQTHCPLCASTASRTFHEDMRRSYRQCLRCQLVFVPPQFFLSADAERAEYDKHENCADDPGYRRFLSRLAIPLLERLPAAAHGLDFGSGPGPALPAMLCEAGHCVDLYDPFYAPNHRVFEHSYDFICATEVVEHLHLPGLELERLWAMLRPGGWLGVMTKLVSSQAAFADWHYKRDPTHVCFFGAATWQWWAAEVGAQIEFVGSDVILLQST